MRLVRTYVREVLSEKRYLHEPEQDVPHGMSFSELREYLSGHFGKGKITLTSGPLDLEASYTQQPGPYKPAGIWYGCGTTWLDWLDWEMSGPDSDDTHIWALKIDMSKVKALVTPEEIDRFTWRYKDIDTYIKTMERSPDWSSVASDFDGIEFCPYPAGDWQYRMKHTWYYSIDVSSGCVWNPSAITNSMLVAELKDDGWEVYV